MTEQTKTVARVVRLCVDSSALTDDQQALIRRHAGTARAVFVGARSDQARAGDAARKGTALSLFFGASWCT
jgi:MOSC domain-containing protein YiiM